MTETAALKTKLLTLCIKYVDDRISATQQAIQSAQASANEETKSSSGDKYETGRAMAQLEIEKIQRSYTKHKNSSMYCNKSMRCTHLKLCKTEASLKPIKKIILFPSQAVSL
jgi:hypothetical protein